MSYWKDVKVPFFTIFFIFFFLFLYTKFAGPLPLYINSIQTNKTDVFQVEGTGQVSAAPDEATISFAVTKQASTVADAQNQTNTEISKIMDSLKSLNIDTKDIKTTDYSVNPNYDFNSRSQDITGYSVTQSVDIKITSLDNVNKTLDALTANGANVIGQMSFGFSDNLKQKLEDQARQDAVQQAKIKAESLANAAGIHLGAIINVTESAVSTPGPIPLLQAEKIAGEGSTPTQVTTGQNTITSTVTLSYQTY